MAKTPELIDDGRSSQRNIEGTHERVKGQITEELNGLKNEIGGTEFYTSNENGKVEYKMDVVQKYLEIKKDKSYIELLNSKNTAAWIMAVQIALCSTGYDVGKVDGILKNKGAKTSKTIEQIIKFQRDNGLKPDGKPGSSTIKKLLEKLGSMEDIHGNGKGEDKQGKEKTDKETNKKDDSKDNNLEKTDEKTKEKDKSKDSNIEEADNKEIITKEKFEELRFKSELSDKEVKQVVDYANKEGGSWLALRIKTIKNKNQLNELSKIKTGLHLNEIHSITNEQLKSLSNVERLSLNGLRKITLEQAKIITSGKVKKLELEGLDGFTNGSMTDAVAYELSKLEELYVNSARLTQNQKQILKNLK